MTIRKTKGISGYDGFIINTGSLIVIDSYEFAKELTKTLEFCNINNTQVHVNDLIVNMQNYNSYIIKKIIILEWGTQLICKPILITNLEDCNSHIDTDKLVGYINRKNSKYVRINNGAKYLSYVSDEYNIDIKTLTYINSNFLVPKQDKPKDIKVEVKIDKYSIDKLFNI